MSEATKIATIRGAGLSFPIACLLFVFFGKPYVFLLLPIGALAGFGAAAAMRYWIARHPSTSSEPKRISTLEPAQAAHPGWFASALFSQNLWLRFIALLAVAAGLFLLAWFAGYYLLPEGIFRGGAQAQMARGALNAPSASVVEEWAKIFRANLLPAVIIIIGSALMRVNRVSMGYLVVWVNVIGYGLFLGTNSLAIAMPERLAPSFSVLARSGPYEMLALTLIAAAAYGLSFFEVKRLFQTNPERITPRPKISAVVLLAAALGLGILAAANWREAVMVMAASL